MNDEFRKAVARSSLRRIGAIEVGVPRPIHLSFGRGLVRFPIKTDLDTELHQALARCISLSPAFAIEPTNPNESPSQRVNGRQLGDLLSDYVAMLWRMSRPAAIGGLIFAIETFNQSDEIEKGEGKGKTFQALAQLVDIVGHSRRHFEEFDASMFYSYDLMIAFGRGQLALDQLSPDQ